MQLPYAALMGAEKRADMGLRIKDTIMKYFCVILLSVLFSGCGAISATSLRCGTDGDSSYLELTSAPQNVSANTRAIGEMCAFAYEGGEE